MAIGESLNIELLQAEELAELKQEGGQAYKQGHYSLAVIYFTQAIEKSSTNSPDPALYNNRNIDSTLGNWSVGLLRCGFYRKD